MSQLIYLGDRAVTMTAVVRNFPWFIRQFPFVGDIKHTHYHQSNTLALASYFKCMCEGPCSVYLSGKWEA